MFTPSHEDPLAQLLAGKLAGAKHLKLSAQLTQFPPELYALADTLEILDLSGNALNDLPNDLTRFRKLRILFCSNNQFTHLPPVLGQCEQLEMIGFKANQIAEVSPHALPTHTLRWLILTDNALTALPDKIGECRHLQKLMLAGNQLTTLPVHMQHCQALALLRVSANQLADLPAWLLALPNLTWLAYAGNPLSQGMEAAAMQKSHLPVIDWQHLTLQQPLGEGASGVTYQALWQQGETQASVAVKLFKSGMTSDGLPQCEVIANLLAGEHPHLVGIKGIIRNHPQGAMGLVMPLLEADLKVLAMPPSFESCTRDVYPAAFRLTRQQARFILEGVTAAANHLHANGLMHGDVYAHNILWRDGKVVLTDLGGASCLPVDQPQLRQQLLQLEARALAVLAEELNRYCS